METIDFLCKTGGRGKGKKMHHCNEIEQKSLVPGCMGHHVAPEIRIMRPGLGLIKPETMPYHASHSIVVNLLLLAYRSPSTQFILII